jgi:hypothetical protein
MKTHAAILFTSFALAQSIFIENRNGTGASCVQSDSVYQTCAGGVCYNEKCTPTIAIDENNCTASEWTLGKPYADCPNAYDVCVGDECVDSSPQKVSTGQQCVGADRACLKNEYCSNTAGCFPRTVGYFSRGTVCDPDMAGDCVSEYPCRANTDYQVYTCGGTGHMKGVGLVTPDGRCKRWAEGIIYHCAEGYACGSDRKCAATSAGLVQKGHACGKDVGTCEPGLWCDNGGKCREDPPMTLSFPIISILTAAFVLVVKVTIL